MKKLMSIIVSILFALSLTGLCFAQDPAESPKAVGPEKKVEKKKAPEKKKAKKVKKAKKAKKGMTSEEAAPLPLPPPPPPEPPAK